MTDSSPSKTGAVEYALRQGDRCRNYGPERVENENVIVILADEVERLQRDMTLLEIVGQQHEQRIAELKQDVARYENGRQVLTLLIDTQKEKIQELEACNSSLMNDLLQGSIKLKEMEHRLAQPPPDALKESVELNVKYEALLHYWLRDFGSTNDLSQRTRTALTKTVRCAPCDDGECSVHPRSPVETDEGRS